MEVRSLRSKLLVSSAVLSSIALAAIAYSAFAAQPARWGPINCRYCTTLQMPYPDQQTIEVLEKFKKDPYPEWDAFTRQVEVGDVVTVCINSICVDYQLNQSKKWEGIKLRKTENFSGGGGGGSGKSGGPFDGSSADGRGKGGNARENERDGKDYVGRGTVTVGKWTRK
ncbi:hypothetical protein MOQ07_11320 [Stenotrophomonas maltophilia]|nr:hypothetical protein [Stenotrophomonas maltophilia]MCI1087231.1 hypothetical protein [Stenotrophomonas maltophilia]MCI1115131.1 hypothetical protein [Stenotrophomonas maltophilia]